MAVKYKDYWEWKAVRDTYCASVAGDCPLTPHLVELMERPWRDAEPYDLDVPRLPGGFGGLRELGRRQTWAERAERARSAQTADRLRKLGIPSRRGR